MIMLSLTVLEASSQDLSKEEQQEIFQKLKQLDSCNLTVSNLYGNNKQLAVQLTERQLKLDSLIKNFDLINKKKDSTITNQSIILDLKSAECESCKQVLAKVTRKSAFKIFMNFRIFDTWLKPKHIVLGIGLGSAAYGGYRFGKLN